jgi:hypothetical protein
MESEILSEMERQLNEEEYTISFFNLFQRDYEMKLKSIIVYVGGKQLQLGNVPDSYIWVGDNPLFYLDFNNSSALILELKYIDR